MATAKPQKSSLVNRNVTTGERRTSVRMEPHVWSALEEYCHREGVTASDFVTQIDRQRAGAKPPQTRTSAIRVALFDYFRAAATPEGHKAAGHGDDPRSGAALD